MYRCERCGDNVNGHCNKVVTMTRPITYFQLVDRKQEVGNGTEIAKEEKLCPKCADTVTEVTVAQPKTTIFIVPKVKIEHEESFDGKEPIRKSRQKRRVAA